MTRLEFKEMMKSYTIMECEIEDVIYLIQDLLGSQANEIEKTEPYATNSIRRLREASREVYGLLDYLEDVMEG